MMFTSPDPAHEQRAVFIEQLAGLHELKDALRQDLHDLVVEEIIFSRQMLEMQQTHKSSTLKALVSDSISEFRQRASVILGELAAAHQETDRIYVALKALRLKTP